MNKKNQIRNITEKLIGKGELDIIEDAFSANYMAHAGDKSYSGHKFIRQFAKQMRNALPDIKVLRIEFLSITDKSVTWQRTFSGTHKADLKGIPPSLKKVKWYEIVVSRFEEEKIVEEWVASDLAFQLMMKHSNSG